MYTMCYELMVLHTLVHGLVRVSTSYKAPSYLNAKLAVWYMM